MNPESVVEVVVQRISPKPGEVVVLTFPGPVTYNQAQAIREGWQELVPGVACIVMSGGGHVSGVLSMDEVSA